jgi:hypothetical protein
MKMEEQIAYHSMGTLADPMRMGFLLSATAGKAYKLHLSGWNGADENVDADFPQVWAPRGDRPDGPKLA